ncbi:MAG: hypothetical protein GF317_17655 [Candidatus Lokiarchaeota archaeon]|nr:hypothetical protein [Candidatus Lokiarchaeota archaeon]MBD3201340.1 hypothetical protein [Candidatus Lokiarchaeota archaeon]
MGDSKLIIHKLSYGGKLLDVSSLDHISLFSSTSIIPIYKKSSKILYTWVGKKAPQSLKNFIPKIRKIISEQYPNQAIIRYVTIDSGDENKDFFDMLNFTEKQLEEQIENLERKRFTIIDDIDQLRVKENNLLMTNNFKEAKRNAEEIIELARQINDMAIEVEQREFIVKIEKMQGDKEKIKLINKEIENIRAEYENLINNNEIFKAHSIISGFYKHWEDIIEENEITPVNLLINKDKEIWSSYIKEQKSIYDDLVNLLDEIENEISERSFDSANDKLIKIGEKRTSLASSEIIDGWFEQTKNINRKYRNLKLKFDTEKAVNEAEKLIRQFSYEEAISKLNGTLENLKNTSLSEESNKLEILKDEIISKKEDYELNNVKLENLKISYDKAIQDDKLNVALYCCESIISTAKLIGKEQIIEKYEKFKIEIEEKINISRKKHKEEQKELFDKAEKLKAIIEVDENVLPLMESFSMDELLGDISEDVNEMMEELGTFLEDHRVSVKEEINNKTLLKSCSGEVRELEKDLKVEKSDIKEEKKFSVNSGLINPFDDVLEEAILTDLIPFNFEINSVELNGKAIEELPNKLLTKDGVEVEWTMKSIKPKESIDINYDLRKRVSRTIIFVLEDELRVIKTHSNISFLDKEGLYDAKMPFSNNFGTSIDGVVVEDIIPLYYIHYIKEPANVLPDKINDSELGNLIKWNIGKMENETKNYYYRLIELYRFEELKININKIEKEAEGALSKGNIRDSIKNYHEIIDILKNYTN